MKRALVAGLLTMTTAGCVMTPDTPTMTQTVAGGYRALADCVYLSLSSESIAWQKVELESVGTTRLILGDDRFQQGRIDFVAAGDERTVVRANMVRPMVNPDMWSNRLRQEIAGCQA